MLIPDAAVKFILFQRTNYLRLWNSKFWRALFKLNPFSSYESVVNFEARLFCDDIKNRYRNDMMEEYRQLQNYLPGKCGAILDIGCGMAGIDTFLYKHYLQSSELRFYLLDKTDIEEKVFYGFKEQGAFYNSLELARELLTQNGIEAEMIFTQEATEKNGILFDTTFDLVISLLSWGHHYPVSVYLEQVYEKLNPGGHLIIDIRTGTDGEKTVMQKFGNLDIVTVNRKNTRIRAIKTA